MRFGPYPFSLRQLQYAVAVASLLSFRKAAERCHVSQPSLSTQIAELERVLGVQLFERDRRRVLVTPAGMVFVERSRAALREADDLLEAVQRASDPLAGTLRLGVIPTLSPYLLPRLAPAIHAAYPKLKVLWMEEKTDGLLRDLEAGTIDAALLALEADIGNLEKEIIARDPFVMVAAAGNPLAGESGPARPSDLRGAEVLLLDHEHCFGRQALAFCSKARAREMDFRATSLSTIAQMVASGAGITLLPEIAVATETRLPGLRVRYFVDPSPGRTIGLVWRRRSPLGAALHQVAATVRDAYGVKDQTRARPKSKRTRARAARTGRG